jgi:hypothetical protein
MPGLREYLNAKKWSESPMMANQPEKMSLHLPSSIPTDSRSLVCTSELANMEAELRHAQCDDSLQGLRLELRLTNCGGKLKIRNGRGQAYYLRSQALMDQIQERQDMHRNTYRAARAAYLTLVGPGSWENSLKILKDEDVRGVSDRVLREEEAETNKRTRRMAGLSEVRQEGEIDLLPDKVKPLTVAEMRHLGEGKRLMSWIWFSVTEAELAADDAPEVVASELFHPICLTIDVVHTICMSALHVAWLKCRARAQRWKEEVELLLKEMQRALLFC